MRNFNGSGRPLTAKRIMNIKVAIDRYNAQNPGTGVKVGGPGANLIAQGLEGNAAKRNGVKAMSAASAAKAMQPAGLTQPQAAKLVKKSLDLFGYTFPADQKAKLAEMLAKYGGGMAPKNQRMLSNYIVNRAITDGLDDEEDIANFYIKDMFGKPDMFSDENPDVFKQVYGDSDRADWNLNGRKVSNPSAQTIVDALTTAVKNPNAVKVVSILMNQGNLADLECLFRKTPALVGDAGAKDMQLEELHTIPGAELFVSREELGLLADFKPAYGFEISPDGTTATVTVSIDKDISTNGSKYNEYKIGTAKITQQTKIDLTKPMPEVVDVTFSQTYVPGQIRHNPNIESAV